MQDKRELKLVASNPDVPDKIIAAIRPLDSRVAPSEGFLERTKLMLLDLTPPSSAGGAQAAA